MIAARDPAGAIDELAQRLARLRPISNSNPHAFYEERSEIAHQMRGVSQWLRTGKRPRDL